jgi:uncharacterized membrane protein YuzA (DUF378 family)
VKSEGRVTLTVRFAKTVYLIAGIYGLIVLVPQFFTEEKTGRDFPPPITHPEYYYGFIGVAVAWQVLFLILSKDPVRYRTMMIPAILEKLSFAIAVLILFFQHRTSSIILIAGIIDMIFGVLFTLAYFKTSTRS